jgi:hypothetical protein
MPALLETGSLLAVIDADDTRDPLEISCNWRVGSSEIH